MLIVEDDADLRDIELQLLKFHGWPVYAASDGVEGLKALREHRPSLILLDLAMPRMNGVQFRTAQRQLPDRRLANVPVVVVGGRDQQMKGNRHLRYPKGTPLANLSLSLMDKFGVNVERFGDSTGELDLLSGV